MRVVRSLPPQTKNPRYGPDNALQPLQPKPLYPQMLKYLPFIPCNHRKQHSFSTKLATFATTATKTICTTNFPHTYLSLQPLQPRPGFLSPNVNIFTLQWLATTAKNIFLLLNSHILNWQLLQPTPFLQLISHISTFDQCNQHPFTQC